MTLHQIRKLYHMRPFQPFTIHMGDGRKVEVAHPEFLALSPEGCSAIVYERSGDFQIIDLLLVTSLRVMKGRRGPFRRRT